MGTIVVRQGGEPRPLFAGHRALDGGGRAALAAWCMSMTIGLAAIGSRAFTGSPAVLGADLVFWSWALGASACVRSLARVLERDGGRLTIPRLACGIVGLMASSQLSWLLLQNTARWPGATAGGITLLAAAALLELRWIYEAARDAGFQRR